MIQISKEKIQDINNILDSYKDKDIRKIVSEFVEDYLFEQEKKVSNFYYFFESLKQVLDLVSSHVLNFNDADKGQSIFSWDSYCEVIQEINTFKNTRPIFKGQLRQILSDLYKYVLKNVSVNNKYINQLTQNSWLLEIEEKSTSRRTTVEWSNFVYQQIHTNFPINSDPVELYLYEYFSPHSSNKDKYIQTVLHFKKTNNFLRELLIEFVESFPKGRGVSIKPSKIQYRQFLYYFGGSLYSVQNEPLSIDFFSLDTFKKQYRFYKTLEDKFPLLAAEKEKKKREVSQSLLSILKEFYLFLLQKIAQDNINHNPFSGSGINGRLLMISSFNVYYEEGFVFVHRNGFESLPNRNRWAIISNGNNATSSKNLINGFDFTEIKDKRYIDDLKSFIWYEHNVSSKVLRDEFRNIKEFLNFKFSFDLQNRNVIKMGHEEMLFSEELMLFYRTHILNKYNGNISSVSKHFGAVKKFIKFVSKKYDSSTSVLNYLELRYRGKKKYGGNPIPLNELDLIKQGIKELKNNPLEELYSIILNLKLTTHLREGEITNLRRDFLVSKDIEKGTGEIQYFSKLSGGTKITRTVTIDKIILIEKAAEITSSLYEDAINEEKEYIFIKKINIYQNTKTGKYFVKQISTEDLNNAFKNIQSLKGLVGNNYKVNNLRHTFKDTIWKEGIKAGLSTMIIEYLTDTTFETDVLNYRAKSTSQRYAEIFSGVTISNVKIDGTIILDDSIVDSLNPVEEGLGACKYNSCQKVDEVINELSDTMYKCLTCSSFITSFSRKKGFKDKINELKIKKEETKSEVEKIHYVNEIKLYTAYYSGLLELNNN
ncbi:tyrosine-type recombinase/integrase [Ferdinandcohnia sp. SAFN-114]|uniref:tyrosine-type recombinase/integrase n=1 Tax=Ferdinandcohnia sp. SAFN-114 TaxID=3387275 RepID=UPI003F80D1EE